MLNLDHIYAKHAGSAHKAIEAAGLSVSGQTDKAENILFFSGGSAIKELAAALPGFSIKSTHIVSTFDSGGSTAELRRVFAVPALGDLRLRLSSLSNNLFFERRLGADARKELDDIIASAGTEFAEYLAYFKAIMPADFRLQGAAVGNLILAAHYLKHRRCLYDTVQHMAKVLGAEGTVLPVSENPVHLGVRLKNGETLLGQHSFTCKDGSCLKAPIAEMFFFHNLDDPAPIEVSPGKDVLESILASSLICYPVGSFFSSVLANLQVNGVGQSIMNSPAKKIYMPNPGKDPESSSLSLQERMETICEVVSGKRQSRGVIDYLLLDTKHCTYPDGLPLDWCQENAVKIIDYSYIDCASSKEPHIVPEKTAIFLKLLSALK